MQEAHKHHVTPDDLWRGAFLFLLVTCRVWCTFKVVQSPCVFGRRDHVHHRVFRSHGERFDGLFEKRVENNDNTGSFLYGA